MLSRLADTSYIALFVSQRRPKDHPAHSQIRTPGKADARLPYIWTPAEDAQLKHLAYLYSLNWNVIADAFATWRKTIATDRRSEFDCMERWHRLYGAASKGNNQDQQSPQVDPSVIAFSAAESEGPSGGLRRGARNAQSRYKEPPPPTPQTPSVQMMPPPGQVPQMRFDSLTRKQIRRGCLIEAIRRMTKKRDATGSKSGYGSGAQREGLPIMPLRIILTKSTVRRFSITSCQEQGPDSHSRHAHHERPRTHS